MNSLTVLDQECTSDVDAVEEMRMGTASLHAGRTSKQ